MNCYKKIFLLLVISLPFNLVGQNIPNQDFEDWTDMGSYEEPDGWVTPNGLSVAPFNNPLCVISVGPPGSFTGSFACEITTIQLTTNPLPGVIPDIIGGILTGAILGGSNIIPGYFYAGRPDTLYLHYKYFPEIGDTGGVFVSFTRYDALLDSTITVGEGNWNVDTTTNNFEFAALPIDWYNADIPDTALIGISSSAGTSPIPDSRFIADSLYFSDADPTVSQIEQDTLAYDLLFIVPPADVAQGVVAWNDSAMLTGATVRINQNFLASEDSLYFTNAGGITGTYSGTTGTIQFSGNATFDQYTTVLRTVQYKNYAASPTLGVKRIDYTITDGLTTSNTGSRFVSIFNSVGIAENLLSAKIQIFPNPSPGEFKISGLPVGSAQIAISDLSGKIVFSGQVDSASLINTREFPAGVYAVSLQCDGFSTPVMKRLVVVK